jgi:DNA-binding Xre family transcriptional regulator
MHVNNSGEMTSGWHDSFKSKFKPWTNKGYYVKEEMLLLWELGIIKDSQLLQLPSKVKLNIIQQTNSPKLIEIALTNKPSKRLKLMCADNLFTPAHYLIELAYDNDSEVRESAMCNPNIPREVVEEYYWQHLTANHPNSQSHDLSKLVSSKWWFIRVNAAKHPNLSLDDLKELCKDLDLNVRASAAKNPNIPIEILKEFANSRSPRVRCSVAQNLKTPIKCLEQLSRDRNEEVRVCVAFNPNTPLELSTSLKAGLAPNILTKYSKQTLLKSDKYNIAANAATPLPQLITIYKSGKNSTEIRFEAIKNICQQIMCNQDVSEDLLDKLVPANDILNDKRLYTVVAYHHNANQEICKRLIRHYSIKLRCSVIKNPNLSIDLLEKLLQDRNPNIRLFALQAYQKRYANHENKSNFIIEWETATHPNTPPEKLAALVKSEWLLVREALAMHPRASEAITTKGTKVTSTVLEKLAKDKRQSVKICVIENPNTSIELLEAIIKAEKYSGKTCLVGLKHLLERAPERAEKHLLQYHQKMHCVDLSTLILQHPAAPIDLLAKKLRLLSWMERYTITQNPKTSRKILDTLAKDANRVVRAAAKERLENI